MSQINPTGIPSDPQLDLLSRKLATLEAELRRSVDRTRARNHSIAFFGIVMVLATAVYMGYAYYRFGTEVTPGLVGANLQGEVQQAMPQVRDQLQKNLQENAPKYVGNILDQLQEVPNRFADRLHEDAQKKLDEQMPQVQQQLADAMKATVEQSQKTVSSAPGSNDEQRFQSMLDALAQTYSTETIKFVDQQHAIYSSEAQSFVDYLNKLAENQDLDHRDQLYRKMFQTMFELVRAREKETGKSQLDTTMLQPAGQ